MINGKELSFINRPKAVFYGCNIALSDFPQNFANMQDVTTYAQKGAASFSKDINFKIKIDTHGTSSDIYLISFESFVLNYDDLGKEYNPNKNDK